MDREKLGFGLLLVVIAVVLLGFGWQTYQNQQADVGQAVEVDGTVQSTDVETLSTTDSANDYSPVVAEESGAGGNTRQTKGGY